MQDVVLGIDLGTTFSAMAWVNDAGQVEILPNQEGENITPSAVLVEGGQFVVGRGALNQAIARPEDVALWIKRQMGNAEFRFQQRYSPEEISAEILRKLVRDASEHLGRPITRAVITVPAYFSSSQRERTQKAGQLAGLVVEEPLDEPEAAAIFFGVSNLKEGERVLVCDLGGGTYDATVLLMKGGVLRAEKTRGSRELGGYDWTSTLVNMVAPRIAQQTGVDPQDDLSLWQRLYDLCEQAKCRLSTMKEVRLPWSWHGQVVDLVVTRDEFETRCQGLTQQVIDKTSQAVADAGLTMAQLTHVLVVGGSSRLPSFVSAIQQLTGKTPRRTGNPDEAVALGAALVAQAYATGSAKKGQGKISLMTGKGSSQTRITIQRTNAHVLATRVAARGAKGFEIVSDPLIRENQDLPASESREYALEPRNTTFQVPVLEMDSHGLVQDEIATFRFQAIPGRTTRSPIRVEFSIDAAKTAVLRAFDLTANKELPGERVKYEEPKIVELPPEAEPVTVVLAVDCSISMGGSKIIQARSAAKDIARKYISPDGSRSVALVNFGGPHSMYPATVMVPPTGSIQLIEAAADRLQADGGTPMEAGMERIRDVLEQVQGKRVAIILTDGQPNDPAKTRQLAQTLKALGITIGTVPIGTDADQNFLRAIGDLESNLKVDNMGQGMAAAVLDILSKV